MHTIHTKGEFSALYRKARTGDTIYLCEKDLVDIRPHTLGIMGIFETRDARHICVNDNTCWPAPHASEYLPFYKDIVIRRGNKFLKRETPEKPFFTYQGDIKECLPHPEGGIIVIDENSPAITLIGKFKLGLQHAKVLQDAPWYAREFVEDGVITQTTDGAFLRNGAEFYRHPKWHPTFQWWPYKKGVAICENGRIVTQDGELLFEGDIHATDTDVISCNGNLVVRKKYTFWRNGHRLSTDYLASSVLHHWLGPVLEWNGTHTLLVIK